MQRFSDKLWVWNILFVAKKGKLQLLLFSISVVGIVKRWDSFMHAINWFDSIAKRQFRFNLIFVVWPFFKCAVSCSRVVVYICKIESDSQRIKQNRNQTKITEKNGFCMEQLYFTVAAAFWKQKFCIVDVAVAVAIATVKQPNRPFKTTMTALLYYKQF